MSRFYLTQEDDEARGDVTDESREDAWREAHPACETCGERMCNAGGPDRGAYSLEQCEGGCMSDHEVVAFVNRDGHGFCATCAPEGRQLQEEDAARAAVAS